MVNLKKLILHSGYPAFKNKNRYTGSVVISGTAVAGTNTRTAVIPLPNVPDIADIVFKGRGEQGFSTPDYSTDPRKTNTWFKNGMVWVRGDSASYSNYPTPWDISAQIVGSTIVVTATTVQQFSETLTLTSETVNIRLVDYIDT